MDARNHRPAFNNILRNVAPRLAEAAASKLDQAIKASVLRPRSSPKPTIAQQIRSATHRADPLLHLQVIKGCLGFTSQVIASNDTFNLSVVDAGIASAATRAARRVEREAERLNRENARLLRQPALPAVPARGRGRGRGRGGWPVVLIIKFSLSCPLTRKEPRLTRGGRALC